MSSSLVAEREQLYFVETGFQRAIQLTFFMIKMQVQVKVARNLEVVAITFWSRATSNKATILILRTEALEVFIKLQHRNNHQISMAWRMRSIAIFCEASYNNIGSLVFLPTDDQWRGN